MANLSDHIDLTRVQKGLDLLESFTNGLEHLAQMHEEQSRRWAELLAYLNPNHANVPDLAEDQRCPHDKKLGARNACDVEADFAFDAWRENR